jgi:hypothetical protein
LKNADRGFKSNLLLAYDEESGKERKTNMYFLVQANDVKEAYDNTIETMKSYYGRLHHSAMRVVHVPLERQH